MRVSSFELELERPGRGPETLISDRKASRQKNRGQKNVPATNETGFVFLSSVFLSAWNGT
jgi:hypothetical protein